MKIMAGDLTTYALMAVSVFLVGCIPHNTILIPTETSKVNEPGVDRVNTNISEVATVTLTSLPITITNTIQPTLTALPKLSQQQAKRLFYKWLIGYPDCVFPCWAGITPEKTYFIRAKQILENVAEIKKEYKNEDCDFGKCDVIRWENIFRPDIYGYIYSRKEDDKVFGMDISSDESLLEYQIDKILSQYGRPEMIYLTTTTFVQDKVLPFEVTLAFSEQRLIIHYIWSARMDADNIIGCGRNGPTYLSVGFDNKVEWDNEYIKKIVYGNRDISSINFKELESVTDLTTTVFFELFKKQPNACLTTPAKYWN
jgi:hypothetical protein